LACRPVPGGSRRPRRSAAGTLWSSKPVDSVAFRAQGLWGPYWDGPASSVNRSHLCRLRILGYSSSIRHKGGSGSWEINHQFPESLGVKRRSRWGSVLRKTSGENSDVWV
jgi:hypothetical protein